MHIQISGLQHTFTTPSGDAHRVLDIATWTLESGEQVLLRGVSGSGKTTLLNILAGLLKPTQGTVTFDERDLYALAEPLRDRLRARAIGYVFQQHYLLAHLTALENVILPLGFDGRAPKSDWRRLGMSMLDAVGLADFARYRPAKMSTGQRLRVAVARALVNSPALLLADEPTAALDAENSAHVLDLIQSLCSASGATLILSSHDPALESRFTRMLTLQAGHLSDTSPRPGTQPVMLTPERSPA